MKGKNLYMAIFFVLASMMSCTYDTPDMEQTDEEAGRIYLSAGIEKSVSSRVPYHPTDENGNPLSTPTGTHPLNVSVWASTVSGSYPNSELNGRTGTVAIHTEAHFQSGEPQLLGDAIYPQKTEGAETAVPVYFIGLHPLSDAWTSSDDNKNASYTFNGKEDVMFAPQISGTYGIAFNNSPKFHFHHLLTWLRIKMVADLTETDVFKKEAIATAWGKIKSLTLLEQQKTVTINNVGEVTKETLSSHVIFSGTSTEIYLYQSGTNDEVFPVMDNYMIPTTETEVAYVMCAPVEGKYQHTVNGEEVLKPEYILHIETDRRGELDIPIDLKVNDDNVEASYFTGSTMGKQFTILLNFKMGDVISVSTEISVGGDTDWFTHGTGTGDLTESDVY